VEEGSVQAPAWRVEAGFVVAVVDSAVVAAAAADF
jgi:hypothetical protein